MKTPLIIISRYSGKQQTFSIVQTLTVSRSTVEKLIHRLVDKMGKPDFSTNKLCVFEKIVQINETRVNFNSKSHCGQSPSNKTDALVMIEFGNHVERMFACI